jgi:hypothetical protein
MLLALLVLMCVSETKLFSGRTMTRGGGGGRRGRGVDVGAGALQRDGRNGVRLSVGKFLIFKHVQTPSGAHPAPTAMATGFFLRCKAAGA